MPAIEQYPHCDMRVLHKPGDCQYCDELPIWQELRETWRINFTGESDPNKLPCPSEKFRPAHVIHRWEGNRPTNVEVPTEPPEPLSTFERILDEEDPI